MRVMTAAKTSVSAMLDELIARSRQLRQEEITNDPLRCGSEAAVTLARIAALALRNKGNAAGPTSCASSPSHR